MQNFLKPAWAREACPSLSKTWFLQSTTKQSTHTQARVSTSKWDSVGRYCPGSTLTGRCSYLLPIRASRGHEGAEGGVSGSIQSQRTVVNDKKLGNMSALNSKVRGAALGFNVPNGGSQCHESSAKGVSPSTVELKCTFYILYTVLKSGSPKRSTFQILLATNPGSHNSCLTEYKQHSPCR